MDKTYVKELRLKVMDTKVLLEESNNPDDQKALLILHLLIDNWDSDRKLTQLEIAKLIPNCGHHELWEMRMGVKLDTTVRKVRSIIEKMLRKRYHLPVLSTPGKGSMRANSAGYWLARERSEAREYMERRQLEIDRSYKSSLKTLRAVAQAFMLDAP
jgi:hypothetical protein